MRCAWSQSRAECRGHSPWEGPLSPHKRDEQCAIRPFGLDPRRAAPHRRSRGRVRTHQVHTRSGAQTVCACDCDLLLFHLRATLLFNPEAVTEVYCPRRRCVCVCTWSVSSVAVGHSNTHAYGLTRHTGALTRTCYFTVHSRSCHRGVQGPQECEQKGGSANPRRHA